MATFEDVRKIALSLPEADEHVGVDELRELLTDAGRSKAPKRLAAAFDEAR